MDTDYLQRFKSKFTSVSPKYDKHTLWYDFLALSAIALSNHTESRRDVFETREKEYENIASKYTPEELNLFTELLSFTLSALFENPAQDFLGEAYMQLGLNDKGHAQIFTPYHIAELMAKMTYTDEMFTETFSDHSYISVSDPCIGGGAMAIASYNNYRDYLTRNYPTKTSMPPFLFYGQDIDINCVRMSYIQLTALGIPAYMKCGDSLTNPITENDTIGCDYWITPTVNMDMMIKEG